jgi:hypothetical protein
MRTDSFVNSRLSENRATINSLCVFIFKFLSRGTSRNFLTPKKQQSSPYLKVLSVFLVFLWEKCTFKRIASLDEGFQNGILIYRSDCNHYKVEFYNYCGCFYSQIYIKNLATDVRVLASGSTLL